MLQITPNLRVLWAVLLACWILSDSEGAPVPAGSRAAVDRTTLFFPLPPGGSPAAETAAQPIAAAGLAAQYPDQAFGNPPGNGWAGYMRLWKAHHDDPSDPYIRRFLGLSLSGSTEVTARRGRSAPSWLRWHSGSFAQLETP